MTLITHNACNSQMLHKLDAEIKHIPYIDDVSETASRLGRMYSMKDSLRVSQWSHVEGASAGGEGETLGETGWDMAEGGWGW